MLQKLALFHFFRVIIIGLHFGFILGTMNILKVKHLKSQKTPTSRTNQIYDESTNTASVLYCATVVPRPLGAEGTAPCRGAVRCVWTESSSQLAIAVTFSSKTIATPVDSLSGNAAANGAIEQGITLQGCTL